jgi:hypothetical protein
LILLVGPVRVAKMDGETKMSCEVQELGIELHFGTSLDDHRFNVVIPMVMGHSCHFSKALDMTLQKELQALVGIEPEIEVSGVGQNHGKSIGCSPGQTHLDPIDLSRLPGKKRQFMVRLPLLLAVLLGIDRNRRIASLELVGLEPLVDLRGLQKGILLIPLIDEALIRLQDRFGQRLWDFLIPNHPADPLLRDAQFFGDLPHTQPFDFIEMSDLTTKNGIHAFPPFWMSIENVVHWSMCLIFSK